MDREAYEIMVREHVDEAVKPSQRRIIEVQSRMGDICQNFMDLDKKVTEFHRDIGEHMGLGKGTLKTQIMQDVFKIRGEMERMINHNTLEAEEARHGIDTRAEVMRVQLANWEHVQAANGSKIELLQAEFEESDKAIQEEL